MLEPPVTRTEHRLGLLDRRTALARIEAGAVVLLPVGALEQHGEHLPIATDALLAEAVCRRAAAAAEGELDILVAAAFWPGFSPHHVRFGATVSLSGSGFIGVLHELLAGLRAWAPRTLVVNGHGGNRGPLTTLALEAGCPVITYWELVESDVTSIFSVDRSIGHAGEAETAMMLAEFPGLVGEPSPTFERPVDRDLLLPELGVSGVIGDARAATAKAGEEFLSAVAAALADHVRKIFPRGPGA